jgi:hypothetical protein
MPQYKRAFSPLKLKDAFLPQPDTLQIRDILSLFITRKMNNYYQFSKNLEFPENGLKGRLLSWQIQFSTVCIVQTCSLFKI